MATYPNIRDDVDLGRLTSDGQRMLLVDLVGDMPFQDVVAGLREALSPEDLAELGAQFDED